MGHVGAHEDELIGYLFDLLSLSLLENCLLALLLCLLDDKRKTNPAVL